VVTASTIVAWVVAVAVWFAVVVVVVVVVVALLLLLLSLLLVVARQSSAKKTAIFFHWPRLCRQIKPPSAMCARGGVLGRRMALSPRLLRTHSSRRSSSNSCSDHGLRPTRTLLWP
jgi:hypothetical protein